MSKLSLRLFELFTIKVLFFYTYSTRMHIDATFTLAMDKIVIIFHIKLIVRIGDMFQEMQKRKPPRMELFNLKHTDRLRTFFLMYTP